MNRRVVLGIGVALVVVVVGVAVWLSRPRGADPISQDDALESFRSTESSTPVEAGDLELPDLGVYTYVSSGREVVKLGPLPAEERPYGDVTTAEVTSGSSDSSTADPEQCFNFTLNLLEQHTEDTTWCRTDTGGIRMDTYVKHQSVAQFDPTVNVTCDPSVIWDPEVESLDVSCDLTLDGGPMEVTTELTGTATSAPAEQVELGDGSTIEAVPVEVNFDLEGTVSGTWSENLWFDEATGLPVKVVRSFNIEGFATFDEQSELLVDSLEPSR